MPKQFEQELNEIAFSYLQSKLPEVTEYIKGFNITDFDEKENKGSGYMILNLNGKFFELPVMFINGELKDIVIMHDHKDNKTYPLNEEWLQYFLSQKHPTLGEGVKDVPNTGSRPFDIHNIISPEGLMGKTSSLKEFNVLDFVKEANVAVKKKFLNMLEKDASLLEYFSDKYQDDFTSVIKTACTIERKDRKPIFRRITSMEKMAGRSLKDKQAFIKLGYVLDDERDKEMTGKSYDVNYETKLSAPLSDGIYTIPTSQGAVECLVALSAVHFHSRHDEYSERDLPPFHYGSERSDDALVLSLESGDYGYVTDNRLLVQPAEYTLLDAIKKLKTIPIKSMKKGKTYIFYDHAKNQDDGNFSIPFFVRQKTTCKDKVIFTATERILPYEEESPNGWQDTDHDTFTIQTRSGTAISTIDNHTYVPEDTMVIEVSGKPKLRILTNSEIDSEMYKKVDQIKLASENLYYNGEHLCKYASAQNAIMNIAYKYDLSLPMASDLVLNDRTFFVKKAMGNVTANDMYPVDDVPDHDLIYPEVEENEKSMDHSGRIEYPQRELAPNDAAGNAPDINTQDLISLSNTKGLDLMNEGITGSLSKLQNPGVVIKKYLPHLNNAMDKLGKILMLIWYHAYKIKNDFGLNEFSEFETKVQDLFEGMGSVIMDIHKKDLNRTLA